VGRLVWNRLRYIKNPETGPRVSRPNPRSEWVTKDVLVATTPQGTAMRDFVLVVQALSSLNSATNDCIGE
jgi:hypothetical protein